MTAESEQRRWILAEGEGHMRDVFLKRYKSTWEMDSFSVK